VSLPLDADPLVVNAGLVLLVLDEAVLAMRLVPLVVLNMVPNNRNQLSYNTVSTFQERKEEPNLYFRYGRP